MISIRLLDLDREKSPIVQFLQANLPYFEHERLFDWLYFHNPEGRALAWGAIDSGTQQIVGIAAAFPRRLFSDGEERRGFILGDFCVDAAHRSLGLALQLQRTCLEGVQRLAEFAIDFPSSAMTAVYRRLRIDFQQTIIRYSKLLRADDKIRQRLGAGFLTGRLSAVMNAGLAIGSIPGRTKRWAIGIQDSPCGEEFTRAAREWSRNMGICVARSASFLNWRYRTHPFRSYEIVSARDGAALMGWLANYTDGKHCVIADVLGSCNAVQVELIRHMVLRARQRGATTVSAPWISGDSACEVLGACGFRAREMSPVIALRFSGSSAKSGGGAAVKWYLTDGDRET